MLSHEEQAQQNAKALRLQQAAKKTFGHLYPAENNLLDKAARSEAQMAIAVSDREEDNDAVKDGDKWLRNREIRSELLRWLCVDEYAKKQVDPHGLSVRGAKITGHLDLSFVAVPFLIEMHDCYFTEQLKIYHADIPELDLSGCRVAGIAAASSNIRGHLWLSDGFRSDGQVSLQSATVRGDLVCEGGTFSNPNRNGPATSAWDPESGIAILAERAVIDGSVYLRFSESKPFDSKGKVGFIGARIGGDFDCEGGKFSNPPIKAFPKSGVALDADGITVGGAAFLRFGFESDGAVLMREAQIGGTLDCSGGNFKNPFQETDKTGGDALILDRAVAKGGMFFRSTSPGPENTFPKFSADGKVSLIDAVIGGTLDMQDGDFSGATLDLTGATAAGISDTGEESWPRQNNLNLLLFQYGNISPAKASERLRWLALQCASDFNTQSYTQLAKVLQQSGDDEGARLVLQTAAEREVKHGHPRWYLRPDNWFQASIGYGYRPIWAVGYISLMSALGWIIYRRAYLAGTIVPTDKEAYNELKSKKCLPPHYPRFSPLILSLENSLPLVKLGQADKWQPEPKQTSKPIHAVSQDPGAQPSDRSPSTESSCENAAVPPRVEMAEQGVTPNPGQYTGTVMHAVAKTPIADSIPPLFRIVRRSVRGILGAVGLQRDVAARTTEASPSRYGTSPTFLKWFVWIQIFLGWLFATLFLAGVTGIVRKQ